jgi:hypothetical protein
MQICVSAIKVENILDSRRLRLDAGRLLHLADDAS